MGLYYHRASIVVALILVVKAQSITPQYREHSIIVQSSSVQHSAVQMALQSSFNHIVL